MNNKVLTIAVVLIVLLTACAPGDSATVNPVDIQHTAEAAAFTMVAQTEAALPTNPPMPPTETESPTALPTLTPIPLPTNDPLLATATTFPAAAGQLPTVASGGNTADNCNKPLTSWQGATINLTVTNETKPQGKITLSLYVVTPLGECGYLTDYSRGPEGSYSAGAFVDGKKSFKVFGGFYIKGGNWDIIVRNDKIIAQGSCYPNC